MAKKKDVIDKTEELIDEVEDLLEDARNEQPEGIVIPWNVVESLLCLHDTSNRVGLTAVCEEIRKMAQDQDPEHFVRPPAKP